MQLLLNGEIKDVQNIKIYNEVSKETKQYVKVSIQQGTTIEYDNHSTVILCSDHEKKLKKSIGCSIVIPYIHTTYWDNNKKKEISVLKMDQEKSFSIHHNNLLEKLYCILISVLKKGENHGK